MTASTWQTTFEKELHDLCQPLTSLMCQLEYGQMLGDPESLQSAVDGSLLECRRLFDAIAGIRERLLEYDA